MRLKPVSIVAYRLSALSFFLIFSSPAAALYNGGTGSWDNPYLISTAQQLNEIGLHPEHWSSCFLLTSDIDMSGYTGTEYNIIGNSPYFTGTFDGDGHVISNFTYLADETTSSIGLFGTLNAATVKNLGIVDVNIQGKSVIAPLAHSVNYSTIDNCYATGEIFSGVKSQLLAGLIASGSIGNTINNCWARVNINSPNGCNNAGGLLGMYTGVLTNCHSSGTLTFGPSSAQVGGLIGYFTSSSFETRVENCYSSSTLDINGSSVGGLIGLSNSYPIINCFTAGSVRGNGTVGGLIGSMRANTTEDIIINCRSESDVEISAYGQYCGGLIGYCEPGNIIDSYSTGSVTAGNNASLIGGFVGRTYNNRIERCYSEASVSAGTNVYGVGGFAGVLYSTIIERCFSDGEVTGAGGTGSWQYGGFAGIQSGGAIYNTYNIANVDGGPSSKWIGGLVGYQGNSLGTIEKSFSAGSVAGGSSLGGLVGYSVTGSIIRTCFYDSDKSGAVTYPGGKAKTTPDMQTESVFTSAGWDFTGETINGTEDIWMMRDYPILSWQNQLAFSGETTLNLAPSESGELSIDVYSFTDDAINWTISGYESFPWITNISQTSGTTTGAGSPASVTIYIDSASLSLGKYVCPLILAGDNGDQTDIFITVEIVDRVRLLQYRSLASWWQTSGCDFGQPCKQADWYIDGTIDTADLMMLSQYWLANSFETFSPTINEGFESGDFSNLAWQHGGDAGWFVDTSSAYEGSFSARSGDIDNSQSSILELTLDTTGWDIDTIDFRVKTSSEQDWDSLYFSIDGQSKGQWSGDSTTWFNASYTISAGVHTYRWVYMKDSDVSLGLDAAWIDSLIFYKK